MANPISKINAKHRSKVDGKTHVIKRGQPLPEGMPKKDVTGYINAGLTYGDGADEKGSNKSS